MSSVPLPNNSDNDRSHTAVPSELEQPGDGTEGTVDRLNEAPRQDPFITAGYILELSDRLGLEDTDREYVKAASDWILYLLREGQPGFPQS